jgi:hypothetical protein
MKLALCSAAMTVGLLGVAGASSGPAPAEVAVPEGSGVPVITDGLFSPGEWDDATRVALTPSVQLHLKQFRGVVFIGVRGSGQGGIGPSDLFLATPGGPIHQLHVSAQLGEKVLAAAGDAPPFRWGYTSDWYANELRRDMQEAERPQKEGRNPIEIMVATSYPSDGIEFAIRRSKISGARWLMRLGASALEGGKPGMLVHPAGSAERTTEGWQVLRLD